jgi:hypothetical protein
MPLGTPRQVRGRRVEVHPPYCFVLIALHWHGARWCPGVPSLIMAGDGPGHVPDDVIAELRSRERDGLVEQQPTEVPADAIEPVEVVP